VETDIGRLRFYCTLLVFVLLVSCTSTGKQPATVQQDQTAQQTLKDKTPLFLNDKMQYHMDVMNTIKASWRLPGEPYNKRDLLTIVLLRIRKDGKIVDINMEQSSGNKAYDESIMRALRAAEPLPVIPSVLNTDFVELGFRFRSDTGEEQSKD
jgi:TonB family protein